MKISSMIEALDQKVKANTRCAWITDGLIVTEPPSFADIFKLEKNQVDSLLKSDVRYWEGKLQTLKEDQSKLSKDFLTTMNDFSDKFR